ncbi:MAG TPA: hemerythrin family protein [Clostridia bacterium]|nr:hemerythrin family protein [Clostridia bacterium]
MMWKEKYRLGVQNIDEQHEELFRRVSEFVLALRQDGSWEEKLPKVKETLAFMQSYVITHFADEEAYQREMQYPGYEEHRRIHEDFKAEVHEFARRFEEEGYLEDTVQQFAGKLLAWLINHVAATDQQIAHFVSGQGRSNNEG